MFRQRRSLATLEHEHELTVWRMREQIDRRGAGDTEGSSSPLLITEAPHVLGERAVAHDIVCAELMAERVARHVDNVSERGRRTQRSAHLGREPGARWVDDRARRAARGTMLIEKSRELLLNPATNHAVSDTIQSRIELRVRSCRRAELNAQDLGAHHLGTQDVGTHQLCVRHLSQAQAARSLERGAYALCVQSAREPDADGAVSAAEIEEEVRWWTLTSASVLCVGVGCLTRGLSEREATGGERGRTDGRHRVLGNAIIQELRARRARLRGV